MKIKSIFKKIDNLVSDTVFFMGLLTNFGLVTVALLFFLIKETLFQWSVLGNLNFIFITYLIISLPTYKSINWGNKEFNKGFIFSFILKLASLN